MSVSFRFDNLEYQRQAVNSVISLLEGQSQDANKNTQEFTKKDTNQLAKLMSQFIPTITILLLAKKVWQKILAKIIMLGEWVWRARLELSRIVKH